ncbi:RNA polymerase II-associated protein 3 [Toxorhynchites rutilus septentrionalis]|uniref:RNA polymerase II-associated protein 3 n=1 Tax=Toxorhynchites rutilus septentrionalis TaxID=329112 RepID=UPI00247966A3|nr:RNA polymerase II-associated protein 3 [Toxorhynchites rutilus septentrionalis]
MSKAIMNQLEVKTKCEQLQQSLKDLYEWEQEMKQKETEKRQQKIKDELSPPVRSQLDEMHKFINDQLKSENTQNEDDLNNKLQEAKYYYESGNNFCGRTKECENPELHKEKYLNAIDMYTKAIDLNSEDPNYHINRANCYFALERYGDCISDCNAAIKLDPTCTGSYYRRMKAFEYLGDNEMAFSDCQKILTLSNDAKEISKIKNDIDRIGKRLKHKADTHKEQGNRHLSDKDYEKAIESFTMAISCFGNEAIYYHNRSLCHFHLKNYESCFEDCNKAIETNREYFRPYYQRMRVHEIRGEYSDAIEDCKKFLELVGNEKQRLTASKDLERLNRLLERTQRLKPCNWSELRKNATGISFIQKPPHLRSKKPLKRVTISEVTSVDDPKADPSGYVIASNYEAIPDSVIDKMFNNNTGERTIEPKEENQLENLFPSSSLMSNKLMKLFAPPSPPAIASEVSMTEKNADTVEAYTRVPALEENIFEDTLTMPNQSEVKQVKEKLNQENCTFHAAEIPSEIKTSGHNDIEDSLTSIPSTSVKFYHTWLNIKSEDVKFTYLKRLQNAQLHKLLGANLSCEMLSEILRVLERNCARDNYSPLWILDEITKNSEAGLLILMLTQEERNILGKLFDLLDTLGENKEYVGEIRRRFAV